ncbi:MAG: sigma 54-interacting transcriptional regulator, partial [Candidatus Krumholzibacteria bacterium]|nr:sigma 54-interacting transcriptional regulator [Candidatus Krumholzibacteria bacterium]
AGRASRPDCQVICLADERSPADAVAAMTQGALTYLEKPLNMQELAAVVERAGDYIALVRDRRALQEEVAGRYGISNIIGNSRPMLKVFERIKQAAVTDATVLIQGETGTGKDVVARAIHFNSHRAAGRFVPLNCAGMVETILESELFGHEKGAFTGALSSRVGMFEYANH